MKKKIIAILMMILACSMLFACKTDKTGEEEAEATALPTNNDQYYTREGDYIYFGAYPQTEVTDSSMQAELTALAGDTESWESYNYYCEGEVSDFMKFKDVTYNEEKYRGVFFTCYRPYFTDSLDAINQERNGYSVNTVYWFKYEPVKWIVLSESNGDAFLFSELLLDAQDFDGVNQKNDYAASCIRKWLNDTFYNTAFNSDEQNIIKTTTVDNSLASADINRSMYGLPEGTDTNDKIFLLSYIEAINSPYVYSDGNAKAKTATDYAKVQGASVISECGKWWLRSRAMDEDTVQTMGGRVSDFSNCTNVSVAPALHISL